MRKKTRKTWRCANCGREMCCSNPIPEEAIIDEEGYWVTEKEVEE
jgi:hypothetical protein